MIFKASSRTGLAIGAIVMTSSLLLSIGLIQGIIKGNIILLVPAIIAFSLTLLFAYCSFVALSLKYVLSEQQIIITSGFSNRAINIKDINNIEISSETKSLLNVGGFNWPGFHYGPCNIEGRINVTLYCTRMYDLILVSYKTETIGISPDEPETFLKEIEKLKSLLKE